MATWHVTPNNDLKPHDNEGTTCECGPRVEFTESGDMIVIHNSYDGREGVEWVNELLKPEQKCCCLDWQKKPNCDGNCHT